MSAHVLLPPPVPPTFLTMNPGPVEIYINSSSKTWSKSNNSSPLSENARSAGLPAVDNTGFHLALELIFEPMHGTLCCHKAVICYLVAEAHAIRGGPSYVQGRKQKLLEAVALVELARMLRR